MHKGRLPKPKIDYDPWHLASALIDEYAEQAWFISAQRADAFLARGDMKGRREWMAVHRAVENLLRTTLADEENWHVACRRRHTWRHGGHLFQAATPTRFCAIRLPWPAVNPLPPQLGGGFRLPSARRRTA